MRPFLHIVIWQLLNHEHPVDASDANTVAPLRLAWLSETGGANGYKGWAAETFPMFRLAIEHVNSDPRFRVNLSWVAANTHTRTESAFSEAVQLLQDPSVVGIVGTAYSSTTTTAALVCSNLRVPIIAWGSSSPALIDKSGMPYLFRTQGAGEAQAMAKLVIRHGWRHIAAVVQRNAFGSALFETFVNAAPSVRLAAYVSVPESFVRSGYDTEEAYTSQLVLAADTIRLSRARIILTFTGSNFDMKAFMGE